MPTFMPGLGLSEHFFREVIEPLMRQLAPDLRYAAGLIGPGSDVLGYDTARSMDHDWGPRLVIWLDDDAFACRHEALSDALARDLPRSYHGFPTSYRRNYDGTHRMTDDEDDAPPDHLVTFSTVRRWFGGGDPANPEHQTWPRLPEQWLDIVLRLEPGEHVPPLDAATWVTLPRQWLLESTAGRVFRDDHGAVTRIRAALAWYPDDVWRYLMAAQWRRIDQLEPFIGRCGEVGDDLGSQLVTMSLVRDVMHLAFLMEQRYAPYPKWLGTAFARLSLASMLVPHLDRARYADTWEEREAGIVAAVETLARHHNTMGLTPWVDPTPRHFFNRPFRVLFAVRFAEALLATMTDPEVRALPVHLGGLDQYMESTDALGRGDLHRAIRAWIARRT